MQYTYINILLVFLYHSRRQKTSGDAARARRCFRNMRNMRNFRHSLFPYESYSYLKEVAVDCDIQTAALNLCQVSCDAESEAASLSVPRSIAADEALHKLVRAYVKLCGRNVSEADVCHAA